MAYAALLLVALLVVLQRSPEPTTPRYAASEDCSIHDLANYCRGVRARVSSFHVFEGHHPMFAIDGRRSRNWLQKWESAPSDPSPWIEVLFPQPVSFSRVRLTHAGYAEPSEYTARAYRLSCASGSRVQAELSVHDNSAPRAEHILVCSDVDRLRIDFDTEPDTPRAVARLYEIDVTP